MNKGLLKSAPLSKGAPSGANTRGLGDDLLVLVLREIEFPKVLVLRRVCRRWDNTINETTRFQGPYARYRLEEITKKALPWNCLPFSKWMIILMDHGLDPSANEDLECEWKTFNEVD